MAITFTLTKLPWHGQIGVFVALSLAMAGAFWHFYAVPAQASLGTRQAQLVTVRSEIDRGLATARRLPEFRREVAELEAQLERLRVVLPEDQDVGDLLRRVQAMATQSNLTIRGFSPQAVARQQLHAEWPFGLQLEGTYHDVGAFLERVSRFPRIINVGSLRIKAKDNDTGGATVTADCIATTFVLIEPPPVAPAKGAKPAAAASPRTE